MKLAIVSEIAPLKTDADGVVRVGEICVILDTVVASSSKEQQQNK